MIKGRDAELDALLADSDDDDGVFTRPSPQLPKRKQPTAHRVAMSKSPARKRKRHHEQQQQQQEEGEEETKGEEEEEEEEDKDDLVLFNGEPGQLGEFQAQRQHPMVVRDYMRIAVPGRIARRLRDYQRVGVKWLFTHYLEGHGAVLGDDMGLGKTIQMIAFIVATLGWTDTRHPEQRSVRSSIARFRQRRKHFSGPVLIITPASVTFQWQQELRTWAPGLQVKVCSGSARMDVLADAQSNLLDVVIVGYEALTCQQVHFTKIRWAYVIMDEVHRLRNVNTHQRQAIMKLSSAIRFGLSGTIIQNKIPELWSVLDVVSPGTFGSEGTFRSRIAQPITHGRKRTASLQTLKRAELAASELETIVQRWVLRRTKDVEMKGKLPEKQDKIIFCALTPLQRLAYERLVTSPDFLNIANSKTLCPCGSKEKAYKCCHKGSEERGVVWEHLDAHRAAKGTDGRFSPCRACPYCVLLPCLQLLAKVANHLDLIRVPVRRKAGDDIAYAEAVARLIFGEDGLRQEHRFQGMASTELCGKMKVLELLLKRWKKEGRKVLLFSYSVRMLDILSSFIEAKGYIYARLDGSTPARARTALCDSFNVDPLQFIFLISTKAGGVGLNLTGASRVVLFDPNWNPSWDLQAQDRAFRIGQTRDVLVYRLMAAGTVEERIYMRQVHKQQLSEVGISNNRPRRFFKDELFGVANLFSFDAHGSPFGDAVRQESVNKGPDDAPLLYEIVDNNLDYRTATSASTLLADFDALDSNECRAGNIHGVLDFLRNDDDQLDVELREAGMRSSHLNKQAIKESPKEKQIARQAANYISVEEREYEQQLAIRRALSAPSHPPTHTNKKKKKNKKTNKEENNEKRNEELQRQRSVPLSLEQRVRMAMHDSSHN